MPEPRRPLSVELRTVLSAALNLAKQRGHQGIDPAEFLVAAIRQDGTTVQPLIRRLRTSEEADVGALVLQRYGSHPGEAMSLPGLIELFGTPDAEGREVTLTELLIGVCESPDSSAHAALVAMGVSPSEVVSEIRQVWLPRSLDIDEFARSGYLQEVNRLFFHPRGLAMGLEFHNGRYVNVVTIYDARQDEEGYVFSEPELLVGKAVIPEQDYQAHLAYRQQMFGTRDGIQPLPSS